MIMEKHLIVMVKEDEKNGGVDVTVDIENVNDKKLCAFVLMALDGIHRSVYRDHSKKSADKLRMVIRCAVNDPRSPLFDINNGTIER